ncbi:DUF4175 family protein [Urechidicola croceus]|uniref:DUF4175 domain-containing protein n=1 Tax=Urechidicola croceus TaxID=1850246 RepID=A0A1D8P979_9FLAO|nr:DUF4175 family protein [Urechidicola croceus]AOW21116.1 hypothetical protein LPB138_10690 [Urechidicola croceus]
MNNFKNIQSKLQEFVKKYYTNELIKGLILFSSFGLLYFIFTLFVEHFLWLKPTARTILFWLFVLVEVGLLVKYILIPIAKLFGLQKGISLEDASKIIGSHFNEVDDKLLNILQLNKESDQSELLLASIEQKSQSLQPIPFKKAINFSNNSKYLKYLAIPVIIWLITLISGNTNIFSDSYDRVIHHQMAYEPPAPFSFNLLNDNLKVIEGKPLTLFVETQGKVVPEDAKINFLDQEYYLQSRGVGNFEYTFSSVQKPVQFYLEANGVTSKPYTIDVIETPSITGLQLFLDYPTYTKKSEETIKNTGNAVVPQGTRITWKVDSKNTESVSFLTTSDAIFELKNENTFEYKKRINESLEYQISTSNSNLMNYETLDFAIQVVKDEYPKINVKSDIDSISRGPIQFAGQLSDDYGLKTLNLVYYDINAKNLKKNHPLKINKSTFEEFYYIFPEGINLQDGIEYEMYFEVSDNDAVNGNKKSKSNTFSYYKKTEKELKDQLLEEQQNSISDLEKSLEKSKEVKDEFKKMQESLQNKSEMNWNDQKKLETFIQRQQQYEKMMERQTEQIQQNLEEQPTQQNESLEERKEEIQKRLEEAKDIAKQEKLLDELKKLAEKLNREELTEKLKKLTEENKQNEKSLERILELTKRFYVEQKANQIKEKLDELAKKQEELADSEENSAEKQKELNEEFDKIQEEIDQLEKDNQDLKRPMKLPKTDTEEKGVEEEQQEATDKLEEGEQNDGDNDNENQKEGQKSASKNQKSAAQKMKKMSGKMSDAMMEMSGGESMDEDIEALRAILENLLEFSFQQEDLMEEFSEIDNAHPDFANKLKQQHVLKEYFEHIDDSLYTLSMRQPKISSEIFKDLSDAHYHLDESLTHFADNQFNTGVSDQQFVMTATNNLAYLLSNILNSMQNASPSMGKGKGKSFSLPDIIQKQGEMIEKMQQGLKPGEKPGEKGDGKEGENGQQNGQQSGDGEGEGMNGELYELYKQQAEMRQMLNDALGDKKGKDGNGIGEKALKQMEQLEQDLLEKGFTNEVLQKMMQLKHELLKLEEAAYEQGQDVKRESNTNVQLFEKRNIKDIDRKKLWFNQNEILNRQSLPLQTIYKKKVQEYFRTNDSIQ